MSTVDALTDVLRQKYHGLRHLLSANTEILEMMADIEADLPHAVPGEPAFRESIIALTERTLLLIQDLVLLAGGRYQELFGIHEKIETDILQYLSSNSIKQSQRLSFPMRDVDARMTQEVGGKAANLAEVSKLLNSAVPPGFMITTAAHRLFLEANDLKAPIRKLLRDLSLISDHHLFKNRTEKIRTLIQSGSVPPAIVEAIEQELRSFSPAVAEWAVRSSALGEDGQSSYAGQFDTFLNISADNLPAAYRSVLASGYSDRAMQYRIEVGSAEIDAPMAVLFMPMIDARVAGVIYSRDPEDKGSDRMMINAVRGLAEDMVQGRAAADVFWASRTEPGEILERRPAYDAVPGKNKDVSISTAEVKTLVESALQIEKHFGRPQDIEWAIDQSGKLAILQARELRLADSQPQQTRSGKLPDPLLSGGITIFAGCAVGNAWIMHPGCGLDAAPEAAVVVVDQASPDLAIVLPKIAGLIAKHGNPAGHAATLIREFGVPSVFGMPNATTVIKDDQSLSLDATRRVVYEGVLWPNVQDRVRLRARHPLRPRARSFLAERIMVLNLVEPQAASFRAKSCRTIHDIVRFVHEKAVETIFKIGDEQARKSGRTAMSLKTDVPLNLRVLNLGGGIALGDRESSVIKPEDITSVPFQALWRGITSPGIKWTGRNRISAAGFASVVASALSQGSEPARSLGANNYLMVAANYICLNTRLAYHFTMVDSIVSDVAENGGAGAERRFLRAQFLAQVLLHSNFGVNRQGDLVTAWLWRHPANACEQALSLIGRLMGCARQLDMILDNSSDVREYVEKFLRGDFESFA